MRSVGARTGVTSEQFQPKVSSVSALSMAASRLTARDNPPYLQPHPRSRSGLIHDRYEISVVPVAILTRDNRVVVKATHGADFNR